MAVLLFFLMYRQRGRVGGEAGISSFKDKKTIQTEGSWKLNKERLITIKTVYSVLLYFLSRRRMRGNGVGEKSGEWS